LTRTSSWPTPLEVSELFKWLRVWHAMQGQLHPLRTRGS
jgi:hypothetical protein